MTPKSLQSRLKIAKNAKFGSTESTERLYDLDSVGPLGLRALRLWLADMGYQVERTGQELFSLSGSDGAPANLLFVYPGVEPYTDEEAKRLYQWVTEGGTLILYGPGLHDGALYETFGVIIDERGFTFDSEWQQQPLIPDGPASYSSLAADIRINLDDVPEAIPVLRIRRGIASEAENIEGEESISENIDEDLSQNSETGGEDDEQTPRTATIAIRSLGEGLVWHLSPRHGFTNNELRDRDEAKLLPALLRTVSEGDVILFDTYHLFGSSNRVQRGEIRTIGEWLYKTATGWATLFGSGAIGLFLLLQGWRLGPALPMTTGTRRREAAEYVEEKPSLQRRTQQRTAVAHYQKHRLKVALARSYHIQTNLDDQRFIERLMNSPHRFDHQQLTMIQQLLEHLDRNPDEASLVKMVREIDGIVKP